MIKKLLPIIIVVVLLLLGGWYFMNSKKSGGIVPGSTNTESQGGAKSLKDLLASGVAQKCTYSSNDQSGSTEGTTYVSGGKVRGDFTSTASGKTTVSHMISDGKTSYIWTDGEKNGFKVAVTEPTPGTAGTEPSSTQGSSGADLNQKADYKCSAWVVDGSYFTPPANVTFTDFSQMFKATSAPSQGSGSSSSSQCSYCNSLSGDDKTQCLSALKCN